ncbi:peptide/nickel transport system substrate-binding protein [Psychromicrobium silvestre]|uniref:Peptide/nickel transport system substrate-binding protein n=1 Tax=Psychromicrobium silvestre TaxID=1645614 RepID=A0A7Y9S8W9_9MICC|nr:ABC transporter family substrate-binding protein [Psychromicrobium silvestre]NYE95767.1 peptide/nickel transport system substrate-binding protein [Psychromicrobium silvestre]
MNKNLKLGGVVVVASALLLTACSGGGNSGGGPSSAGAETAGADVNKLISINAQPVDNLKQGGTFTLPVGNLGPDFSPFNQNGNNTDNILMLGPVNVAATTGCWLLEANGTPKLNKDFCESFDSKIDGTKQTITIKINDKAVWNNGTPIAADTFINSWKQLSGTIKENNIVTPGAWENIANVVQGATPKDVVVTMKQPTYPLSDLFAGLVNPAINTTKIFNDGFVDNLHPEWMAGPFKVDKYDPAAKTVSMVPNDKWWGEKPVLSSIVFRQMESAATIAAFKNKEIDIAGGRTINAFNQLKGTPDSEVRTGQRLFGGGLNINAAMAPMNDVTVRQAILTAVNRQEIAKVRYNGLNWTETPPGSQMLMPFSPYYQDNYPVKTTGADAAKKVFTDAGYTVGSDGKVVKDGKKVSFKITNFGDDPTALATVQTLQKQLQDAGMDVTIDQKGDNDFGKVVGERTFQMTMSGYSMGADATSAVKQYYDSKNGEFGVGDAAIDARIAKVSSIADDAERNKAAMDIEKDFMAKYFVPGIAFNGPDIFYVRTGLANYGASLFQTIDWSTVGFQK